MSCLCHFPSYEYIVFHLRKWEICQSWRKMCYLYLECYYYFSFILFLSSDLKFISIIIWAFPMLLISWLAEGLTSKEEGLGWCCRNVIDNVVTLFPEHTAKCFGIWLKKLHSKNGFNHRLFAQIIKGSPSHWWHDDITCVCWKWYCHIRNEVLVILAWNFFAASNNSFFQLVARRDQTILMRTDKKGVYWNNCSPLLYNFWISRSNLCKMQHFALPQYHLKIAPIVTTILHIVFFFNHLSTHVSYFHLLTYLLTYYGYRSLPSHAWQPNFSLSLSTQDKHM